MTGFDISSPGFHFFLSFVLPFGPDCTAKGNTKPELPKLVTREKTVHWLVSASHTSHFGGGCNRCLEDPVGAGREC